MQQKARVIGPGLRVQEMPGRFTCREAIGVLRSGFRHYRNLAFNTPSALKSFSFRDSGHPTP